jgi:hypothetical protein
MPIQWPEPPCGLRRSEQGHIIQPAAVFKRSDYYLLVIYVPSIHLLQSSGCYVQAFASQVDTFLPKACNQFNSNFEEKL